MLKQAMPPASGTGRTGTRSAATPIAEIRFYMALLIAALLTFVLHEAAHALAGMAMGHDMQIGLNSVSARGGAAMAARDAFLVTAAGPLATVLQAVIAWLVIARGKIGRSGAGVAYAFLFAAWFMRFAAAFVSLFHPNDEARLGLMLGWNMWLLPGAMVITLLALTWAGARRLRVRWMTNAAAYVTCSAAFAAIVFGAAAVQP